MIILIKNLSGLFSNKQTYHNIIYTKKLYYGFIIITRFILFKMYAKINLREFTHAIRFSRSASLFFVSTRNLDAIIYLSISYCILVTLKKKKNEYIIRSYNIELFVVKKAYYLYNISKYNIRYLLLYSYIYIFIYWKSIIL